MQEVDIGLAADLGTLQRLPKVVGNESLVRELAFTARKFDADEAKSFGFVRYSDQRPVYTFQRRYRHRHRARQSLALYL